MIKFDSQYILNSITPLENMFIQQYLVKAPGDYVKVYIYCLNLCHWPMGDVHVSYESIAETLRLNCEDVQRALRYWCKLGVMSVECFEEQLEMEIYSVKETMARNEASDGQTLYTYRAFNNELSDAFHPRILDTQDYLLYQDMINIFEVSQEYVIEAVKYSVKTSGDVNIPYKYVERVIEAWKNDNINSVSELKTYLEKRDSTYRELCSVLRYLGMNRAPTIPELNYYKKWTDEFGFSFDAIKEACNATVGASNPTIKYLDSIITALHEKKASTPQQIAKDKEKSTNARLKVRRLLYYLGINGAPSAVHLQKYAKWEDDYHFTEEAITIAASMITPGRNPFDSLDSLLESFYMKGIQDADSMLMYSNQKKEHDTEIGELKTLLGDTSPITDIQRDTFKRWLDEYKMPVEVIFLAAALAQEADKPWGYVNKVLSNWSAAGINTKQAAQEQMASFSKPQSNQTQKPSKNTKGYGFTNIESHTYNESDYASMFDELSDDTNA